MTGKRKWMYLAGAVAVLLVVSLLGWLAWQRGWLQSPQQRKLTQMGLRLDNKPALLFFNNYSLCPSRREGFRAIDVQVMSWPEAARGGVPVISLDPARSEAAAEYYEINSLPALLLVDGQGQVLERQDGLSLGLNVTLLDLAPFEARIRSLR